MARLLTQAQFARRHGKSRGWICQLIKAGVVGLVKGKIDPQKAEEAIAASIDTRNTDSRPRPKPRKRSSQKSVQGNGLTLTDVRTRHETAKAELAELKLQIQRGDLVPKGEQLVWLSMHVIQAKNALWTLPRRMAETLAIETDGREIESLLRSELRRILTDLAAPINRPRWQEAFQKSLSILDNDQDDDPFLINGKEAVVS